MIEERQPADERGSLDMGSSGSTLIRRVLSETPVLSSVRHVVDSELRADSLSSSSGKMDSRTCATTVSEGPG